MRPAQARLFAALAAAALALTGCMANASTPGPEATGPEVRGSEASAPASPSAASSSTPPAPSNATPGADTAGTTAAATPPSSASVPAGLATYTFPDGRLSFEYPADWRVELFEAAASPFVGTATVYDASGARQAEIYTGEIADGVSSPVTRTVFESVPVPGLQRQPDPAAHYSFYVDNVNDLATYRMHLTPGAPLAGAEMALGGIIRIGDRILMAEVDFIDNTFASDEAARSWLAGPEGQALRALLMSVSYA
jgi:hypothetical protein